MTEAILKAVALTLGYIDGTGAAYHPGSEKQAKAFLEHLASQGFVVRLRDGARLRLKPGPMDQRRTSGADIRAARMALELSLGQLAARAGIGQETLALIEGGRRSPREQTLVAILDALASARAEGSDRI